MPHLLPISQGQHRDTTGTTARLPAGRVASGIMGGNGTSLFAPADGHMRNFWAAVLRAGPESGRPTMAKRSPAPFGALLKQYRQAALLTQEQLAARAQLSPDAIRALERGKRRTPRAETIKLLGEALGLPDEEREALLAAALSPPAPDPDVTEADHATWLHPPPDVMAAAPLLDGDSQSLEAPLVGRQHEFEALRSAWERVQGGHSQVVLLEGEPGHWQDAARQGVSAWSEAQGPRCCGGRPMRQVRVCPTNP